MDPCDKKIVVSTPARICLMGEHQDYYGLASITAAINLRISLVAHPRNDSVLFIHMRDLNRTEKIHLRKKIQYHSQTDYLRSGLHLLLQQGLTLPSGFDVEISSQIPLAKGISSSSAFVVLWIRFLTHVAGWSEFPLEEIALQAYRSEVEEFNEAGGMMDHYATAVGGILHIDCEQPYTITRIQKDLTGFLLGDSHSTKDTQGVLSNLKNQVLQAAQELKKYVPDFSFRKTTIADIEPILPRINKGSPRMLLATLENRDLTTDTFKLLKSSVLPKEDLNRKLGELMNKHHRSLRDGLQISTPIMEKMRDEALKNGALGSKVNGSGSGGFLLVFAPGKENNIIQCLKRLGYTAIPVHVDSGTVIEK